jgi:AraC family transcriptional regulator
LKAYPKISFHISIKGDVEMNYRIEDKEAFEVFGVSRDINAVDEKPYIEIPEFWERCQSDGTEDKIHKIAGIDEEVCCHGALFNWGSNSISVTKGKVSVN